MEFEKEVNMQHQSQEIIRNPHKTCSTVPFMSCKNAAKDITCRQGKLPLCTPIFACQEFHFPTAVFINNLPKHVLLCRCSGDYLQMPNCPVK